MLRSLTKTLQRDLNEMGLGAQNSLSHVFVPFLLDGFKNESVTDGVGGRPRRQSILNVFGMLLGFSFLAW